LAGAGGRRGASVWARTNAEPSTVNAIVRIPFGVIVIDLLLQEFVSD
jgi:hypothetical protein